MEAKGASSASGRGRQVAVVVYDGQPGGVVVVETDGGRGIEQEVCTEKVAGMCHLSCTSLYRGTSSFIMHQLKRYATPAQMNTMK